MKLETSGVCHTDLHAAHGDWPVKPQPRSSPATRAKAPSSRSVRVWTTSRSVTRSATRGCGRRAAAANTAAPTDPRPGQWVAVSGIGGLGHIAVQYARAMGLRVVAIDIDDSKLALATRLGAEVAVNARTSDVVAEVQKATGGVHGVLVTAVHPQALSTAASSSTTERANDTGLTRVGVTLRGVVIRGRCECR